MSKRITNIWSAFYEDRAEAENLRIRSKLMIAIERYIAENDLTQTTAAEMMKTTQPRITNVVKGKIDKFTIDMLINMLANVGVAVDVRVPELLPEDRQQAHSPFTGEGSRVVLTTTVRVSDDYFYGSGKGPVNEPIDPILVETGDYNECTSAAAA